MTTDKPTAVIVDIDGTLCDTRSIEHLLARPGRKFDEFHEASRDCPPNLYALNYALDAYRLGHTIIAMTGRPQRFEELTTEWLNKNLLVPYEGPVMRPDSDRRPAAIMKQVMLRAVQGFYTVVSAIDDDSTVIEMFTNNGIPAVLMPTQEVTTP